MEARNANKKLAQTYNALLDTSVLGYHFLGHQNLLSDFGILGLKVRKG